MGRNGDSRLGQGGLWQPVTLVLGKPFIQLGLKGGVTGLGFGGAQGDMGELGGRLDYPHWGPWKSPSDAKD